MKMDSNIQVCFFKKALYERVVRDFKNLVQDFFTFSWIATQEWNDSQKTDFVYTSCPLEANGDEVVKYNVLHKKSARQDDDI